MLDGAQCLGRGSVAAKHDQMAAQLEQADDRLACELIDHIERARAVGSTRVVAQIDIVVLGHEVVDALEDGQAPIARVEDADGAGRGGEVHRSASLTS